MNLINPFDIVEVKHLVKHGDMITELWLPATVYRVMSDNIEVRYLKIYENQVEHLLLRKQDFGINWRVTR
jgi:hypothetical protein